MIRLHEIGGHDLSQVAPTVIPSRDRLQTRLLSLSLSRPQKCRVRTAEHNRILRQEAKLIRGGDGGYYAVDADEVENAA